MVNACVFIIPVNAEVRNSGIISTTAHEWLALSNAVQHRYLKTFAARHMNRLSIINTNIFLFLNKQT